MLTEGDHKADLLRAYRETKRARKHSPKRKRKGMTFTEKLLVKRIKNNVKLEFPHEEILKQPIYADLWMEGQHQMDIDLNPRAKMKSMSA